MKKIIIVLCMMFVLLTLPNILAFNNKGRADENVGRGIDEAIFRVQNQETKERLLSVQKTIQEKHQQRFQYLDNVEITEDNNEIIISGIGRAKFLGFFEVNKEQRFQYLEQTEELVRKPKWFDFMFTKIE
jgi:hypothetical protein